MHSRFVRRISRSHSENTKNLEPAQRTLVACALTFLVACGAPAEDRASKGSASNPPPLQPTPPPAAPQPTPAQRAEDADRAERASEQEAASTAEAQAVRTDAIEQARAAGILGSTELQGPVVPIDPNDDVAAGPTLALGQATVKPAVAAGDGELDKAIVRRYIKRNLQKLQSCYEKELLSKPTLSGTVATSFTITETGVVGSATASGVDATVASCMAQVIKGIEFPKPKGTGGVAVSYPFTVRPAAP